ncbi:transporter [Spirochaetia bacterium]|nr:transporter [Spirochaetia bacterium]
MEKIQNILSVVFWGNTVRSWLFALACIAGGFIAGTLCSIILTTIAKRIAKKTKNSLDDALIIALKNPFTVLFCIGGIALGVRLLTFREPAAELIQRVLSSGVILVLAWALVRILDIIIIHIVPPKGTSFLSKREVDIQPILRKFFKMLIWVLGIVLFLRNLGYNVSGLMAGLGLGGAAVALASKDTLANFFGSITVFVDRPFRINDRIKINGFEGFITDIGIRTARIRTLDNHTVVIPNSLFAANPIENISVEPNTKVSQIFNIKRDKGREIVESALKILIDIASSVPGTGGTPQAAITGITGNACQVTFVFYVAKGSDYLNTVNKVNAEVLKRFEEQGISLA